MKTKCINDMSLGDMNISRLMTHAHQVEGDKLKEQAMENKKARIGNYDYFQHKLVACRVSRSFQLHPLHQLVFHLPRKGMTRRLEIQALSLREVFQAPTLTPLALSVVRAIRAYVLQEKKDVLGAVSLFTG